MSDEKIRILLVDDDDIDCRAVIRHVDKERLPYLLRVAESETQALAALEEADFDVILLDYNLGAATGLDVLPYTRDIPVIFVTGGGNEKIAVEAMRQGASDYIIKDSDRNYLAVLPVTIRNVMERKLAERVLREREERFRALTEKVSDIVIIVDKHNILTYVSPSVRLFGYRPEEMVGKPPLDFIHPEDAAPLKDSLAESIRRPGKTVVTPDIRVLEKDGPYHFIEGVMTCLYDQPGVRGVVFNGRDITERKRAEEERLRLEAHVQQAQKFDSLYLMAGSIAHTFNNYLMGVLGNLELALSNLPAQSPVKPYIEKSDRAAKRVAQLSRLMLTYVGQAKGETRTIGLQELLEDMSRMLEASISKKMKLVFKLPQSPHFFKGDPSQMRQVVMSLISNATEAIGATEGTITISTGVVYCDSDQFQQPFLQEDLPAGDYVYLDVADTGCGMEAHIQVKAFDPFFSTRSKGRGMGLAAVLGIVRAHHGTVTLDSRPGEGTTVRILVPTAEGPSESLVVKPEVSGEWHGSGTVLLVDDEEMVQEVGRDMLEELGFRVLTADDGIEAVSRFREHREEIVCIILDMNMPRMGGDEAFHELRQIDSTIPVILCSGFTEEQVAKRFLDDLPAPFMGKPFQLSVLAGKLRQLLRG